MEATATTVVTTTTLAVRTAVVVGSGVAEATLSAAVVKLRERL